MNTYKCDQCPAAFRLHGELRTHRQQHFLESKGMLGDQSSQEGFDRSETENEENAKNVNDELQNMFRDAAKNDIRYELQTSSQPSVFVSDKQLPQQQHTTYDAQIM